MLIIIALLKPYSHIPVLMTMLDLCRKVRQKFLTIYASPLLHKNHISVLSKNKSKMKVNLVSSV